jgi:hypothetical protein
MVYSSPSSGKGEPGYLHDSDDASSVRYSTCPVIRENAGNELDVKVEQRAHAD